MDLSHLSSFERLTGLAFFTPDGAVPAIHLGNIEMVRSDFGLEVRDSVMSVRGIVSPRRRVVRRRNQIFTISGNQFPTAAMPLHIAGSQGANTTQAAAEGATYTFTAVPGGAFFVGKSAITVTSVTVAGVAKIANYDYFLDAYNGIIWLPSTGGSIVNGNTVIVTYSCPALALETYTALDTLSRDGQLVVFAEDHFGPPARERWTMTVTLMVKALPDTDPGKFRSWEAECIVFGTPQVLKRPFPAAFAELLTDTGDVLDFS